MDKAEFGHFMKCGVTPKQKVHSFKVSPSALLHPGRCQPIFSRQSVPFFHMTTDAANLFQVLKFSVDILTLDNLSLYKQNRKLNRALRVWLPLLLLVLHVTS